MGTDIVPTKLDLEIARKGVATHYEAAIKKGSCYSMEDMLENQAQVVAHLCAYNRHLENLIKDSK